MGPHIVGTFRVFVVVVKPKMNRPLVPPLGRALLVLSAFALAAGALGALVALVALVVLVVLPPPLVQAAPLTSSCKLLQSLHT